MKDNNTPRNIRLKRRIAKLYGKQYQLEPIPYGGGNPYYQCASCNRSMVEASYKGHYKGCQYVGLDKEIEYYKSLLTETNENERKHT